MNKIKKINRLKLLIKLEAAWAFLSFVGFFIILPFGKKINDILLYFLIIFFFLGLALGYYLVFLHNKQLRNLKGKEAHNLEAGLVTKDIMKASWWIGGLH